MLRLVTDSSPLQRLQYQIIPSRFRPGHEATELYNRAFNFWKDFWIEVLKGNGSPHELNQNQFMSSDMIGVLTAGEDIVAVYLHSFMNLELSNVDSHPYFAEAGGQVFLKTARERHLRSTMSIEMFAVHQDWRKSKIGISLIPIFGGLAYELQKSLRIDACFGRCRQQVHMSSLFLDRGGLAIQRDVMMHNTLTDFCAVFAGETTPHSDSQVMLWIANLWNARADWSGLTLNESERQSNIRPRLTVVEQKAG